MYEQVEKPKENKRSSVANSVAQKKGNVRQGFGFVDNRTKSIKPTDLQRLENERFYGRDFRTDTKENPSPLNSDQKMSVVQRVIDSRIQI